MATYTSNYAWTKPGGNDQVDISVLNGNLDSQDTIMHKAFTNMAQAFSAASTYAVGDIVLYDNVLYKCHTAVTVAGAWTGSTNWQVYKLSEGGSGGGGTSNYNDLTNKPSINGVTLSGNKTTSDLGIDKTAVGLSNVPNVSTNDQEPTFTEASTRNNIASGEKLSVILGKVQKFFNDLKTVAFSGSYTDLTNKPTIPTSAGDITYDNTDSGLSATNVQGAVDELAQSYPADQVMMSDGVTNVEDRITANTVSNRVILSGYTVDNKYTCPTDGYVFVVNNHDNDGYLTIDTFVSIGMGKGRFTTFVRKGTQVWNVGTPDYVYFASLQ